MMFLRGWLDIFPSNMNYLCSISDGKSRHGMYTHIQTALCLLVLSRHDISIGANDCGGDVNNTMTLDESLTSMGCPVEPAHTIYSKSNILDLNLARDLSWAYVSSSSLAPHISCRS